MKNLAKSLEILAFVLFFALILFTGGALIERELEVLINIISQK